MESQTETKKQYLTIHGHFYQPPRENPWTGAIDLQIGAKPFHDWNEKINSECYCPNTKARLLGKDGKDEKLINNYSNISFNMGPTFLNWLNKFDKGTLKKILEADKLSVEKNNGHGNAIAQVYNHIIMPLAQIHDQETQIIWGLKHFKYYFKRAPESVWLAETAINDVTANLLIKHGIKFIILAPSQAEKIKRIGSTKDYIDVSNGDINPRRAYRLFKTDIKGVKDEREYLDVFFYDGSLSRAVGFEHLLRDAETFAGRISSAYNLNAKENQLLNIATDGESYGHHEKFGDMALAYLYEKAISKLKIIPTNYGHFLEMNPPPYEIILKKGPDSEGTAWSCVHGVGRWYRDCGCSTGGKEGSNQRWRSPLRMGLNALKEAIDIIFELEGKKYFKNHWAARNDYIDVILNEDNNDIRDKFFLAHATNNNPDKMLKLLNMELFSLYMFTSCAWFFHDIAGIETIQNLAYACRAIEFAQSFTEIPLEENLMAFLKLAKSNDPIKKNGAEIYKNEVKPLQKKHQKI